MPEAFAVLFALGLLGGALTALVLGVIAFARTLRLRQLTRRVDELERQLRATPSVPADRRAAAEVTRTEAPPPPSVARPIPAPPTLPEPEPATGPAPVPIEPPAPGSEVPIATLGPAEESEQPPPARPAVRIDWERWVGVRGAALVGGLLLALSGLLLVQYSIQRGWITPALRIALAGGAGIASLLASELLHRRGYRHVSNALAGAGAVMVYGALWAGRTLYGLFGFGLAFPGMVAVTLASGWMALRRPSLVVVSFALVGGFATPLLVSLGAERPLGLFGYLLVFDIGLVAVARRPRWGLLGLLGSIGTLGVFAVFVLRRLQPGDGPLALAFLGLSSLVLALPVLMDSREVRAGREVLGAALALLGSFPLALYVATKGELEQQLIPLALLGATLQALAGLVAWRRRVPLLAAGAALGAVALVLAWVLSAPVTDVRARHLVVAVAGLALVPHVLLEWRARSRQAARELAAPLAAVGLAGCFVLAALRDGSLGPAPVLVAGVVLAAPLVRQAHLGAGAWLLRLAAIVPGALWLAYQVGRLDLHDEGGWDSWPATWSYLLVAVVALFALHAFAVRRGALGRQAWNALAWAAVVAIVSLAPLRIEILLGAQDSVPLGASPALVLQATLALLVLAAIGAAVGGSTLALLAAAAAAAAVQTLVTAPDVPGSLVAPGRWTALLLGSALVVSLTPALSGERLAARGRAWAVSALAPWLWLASLLALFADHVDRGWRAAPALGLAACAALCWWTASRSGVLTGEGRQLARRAALAFGASSTLALLSLALTLQLERGVWFVAPALAAAGAALTYRRVLHPALPWVAAALLVWSTARLGLEVLLLAENENVWPRSGLPLVHWGTYGWALPAAAALASSVALRRGGLARAASWCATACGVCGLLLLFVWVNLEVQNLFQDGPRLELELEREPVRDVATSIAWGLYALGLLIAGLRTRGAGLRWASLAFFLAALVKVFLLDLGNLEGLYRVASIAALAVALLAVSLLYQRFVFRREERDEADAARA